MDIVLYVNADPYGQALLRDSLNERPLGDPVDIAFGVETRLNIVIFKDEDSGTEPFQVPEEIFDWVFAIDNDFDHATPPVIQTGNVQVQQSESETRIIAKCSSEMMSNPALAELLSGQEDSNGFIGELAGYDKPACYDDAKCIFCLQIKGFRFRNRICFCNSNNS